MKIPEESSSNEYRRQKEVKDINMKIIVQRVILSLSYFSVVPQGGAKVPFIFFKKPCTIVYNTSRYKRICEKAEYPSQSVRKSYKIAMLNVLRTKKLYRVQCTGGMRGQCSDCGGQCLVFTRKINYSPQKKYHTYHTYDVTGFRPT